MLLRNAAHRAAATSTAATPAAPRRVPARALSSNNGSSYDVVIIGAGVIGSSCALQLNRKGYRTLSIDKGPAAGSGSTSYSSGNLRSMCESRPLGSLTALHSSCFSSRRRWCTFDHRCALQTPP